MPLGGDYTVTLTYRNVPRDAVEHTMEDLRQNGDYPADEVELEVDDETESDEYIY